jgi:hypothetical protein
VTAPPVPRPVAAGPARPRRRTAVALSGAAVTLLLAATAALVETFATPHDI